MPQLPPLQKQKIILVAGIVLGIVAVLMTKAYIDKQKQEVTVQAQKALVNIQANQSPVLIAKEDIPKGAALEAGMLTTGVVPNQYLQPQAVTSLDRVFGMIVSAPISQGEQITLNKLSQRRYAGGGLAQATPVGKRAVTISVDSIASVGGMINPGDYVDVMSLLPIPVQTLEGKTEAQAAVIPLFQNVLVLAVGQQIEPLAAQSSSRYKKEESKESSPLITLALNPEESSLLAFVQEQGKTRLILRSPADSQIEYTRPASWDTLFQYIMPKTEAEQKPIEKPMTEGTFVEIYRGMSKEKIPLSAK